MRSSPPTPVYSIDGMLCGDMNVSEESGNMLIIEAIYKAHISQAHN